jgi:hypothetical protein
VWYYLGEYGRDICSTFHVADATIAFAEIEVGRMEDLKGHFLAMAAAFVQDLFVHLDLSGRLYIV